jgi:hypothetical protein
MTQYLRFDCLGSHGHDDNPTLSIFFNLSILSNYILKFHHEAKVGEQKSATGSHIGGYRSSSTLDVICVNDMFYRRLSFTITALQNRREIPILLVDHVIMVKLTMWGYHRDHEILDSQTSNIGATISPNM